VLELIALVLPLALDTFAVAAALGVAGLSSSQRLRVSLIFTSFEAGMPLIGVVIGHALGHAVWAIVLIAAQAFVAAQLGMRLGGRVGARFPEHMEQAAGVALIALGIVLLLARVAS
jgi:putative Mn2+ efflux pump MntP